MLEQQYHKLIQVKQAMRMRRITCKALDGSVRRAAKARQDPTSKRWYLPLTDKEVRKKCNGGV